MFAFFTKLFFGCSLKVKTGLYFMPPYLSDGAKDLIRKMLVVDPADRISMEDIFAHSWFNSNSTSLTKSVVPSSYVEVCIWNNGLHSSSFLFDEFILCKVLMPFLGVVCSLFLLFWSVALLR